MLNCKWGQGRRWNPLVLKQTMILTFFLNKSVTICQICSNSEPNPIWRPHLFKNLKMGELCFGSPAVAIQTAYMLLGHPAYDIIADPDWFAEQVKCLLYVVVKKGCLKGRINDARLTTWFLVFVQHLLSDVLISLIQRIHDQTYSKQGLKSWPN